MKIHKGKCDLLWDCAQIEEGGNGGAVQQRGKGGWRFAADAARLTDERGGSEDQKSNQEEFFAVNSNLGAVVGEKEGAITSIPCNGGRITQAWVNVRGGMRVFARARITKHQWLVACDA